MSKKWEKKQLLYKNNCKQIITLSKSIRYVGIINEYGRTLSGILKNGIKPMFNKNQVRNEFFAITSFLKLRSKINPSIGKMNYILLNHEKVLSVVLYHENVVYYITFSKNSRILLSVNLQLSFLKSLYFPS